MRIAMIRHFRTPGNIKRQYIGRTDEPLAEEDGLKERVKEAGLRMREMGEVECVAASPMRRCVQSAELLFPGIQPLLCERMRECDFGSFEGRSYEELKELPDYQKWLNSGGTIPFPDGESHEAFTERCIHGFEEMLAVFIERHASQAAVVVHGGTIMAVLSRFDREKRPFYHWQAENGGGYFITVDVGKWMQKEKVFEEIESL